MTSAFPSEQLGKATIIARVWARTGAVAAAAGAVAVVLLLAGVLALVSGSEGSSAAAAAAAARASGACEQSVVADWQRDGRVDGVYPLSCYRRALAQLPADVRDYSDAPTEIERALAVASNRTAEPAATSRTSASNDAPPLVLIAIGGGTALAAALGGVALVTRLRRRPAS